MAPQFSSFHIIALDPAPYAHLAGLGDDALMALGVRRLRAEEKLGYPCRVTLEDAEPGEALLLLNHEHLSGNTPYAARGPIFVRENALYPARVASGTVPEMLRRRLLSIRGYDEAGLMQDADVVEGQEAEVLLKRLFENASFAFAHIHFARRGCYAARVERIEGQ